MSGADPALQRLADGEATAEDRAALVRLAADPERRRRIAGQAAVHGLLGLALEDRHAGARFAARVTGAIVPGREAFSDEVVAALAPRRGLRWWRPSLAGLAAAAALVIGLALVLVSGPAPAGRIIASTAATWNSPPPKHGIPGGTRLDLAGGLVEIELQGRGTLVVEGPSVIDLVDPMRVILHRGRVVMHATPAGHGFRLETPGGSLIDLGTRFGVSVAADGSTEAHVLEGAIEAIGQGGARTVLAGDQAARLGPGGISAITADPDAFYTALPPPQTAAPMRLRWPLDEAAGGIAKAVVEGYTGPPADFRLLQDGDGGQPRWIAGRLGGALAFDGHGAYAESDFPGIAGTGARTVACWVRVPRDFTPQDGFAIVSWGDFRAGVDGAVWQISVNPLAADGVVGRIRVGTSRGLIVGTTDLRDGAWHHLAVVMYGGERPTMGTHVVVYVDGELEPLSRRTLHPIDTRISGAGHGVWLGRNITHVQNRPTGPAAPVRGNGHGRFLRGDIDELVIVGGALDQATVRRLAGLAKP